LQSIDELLEFLQTWGFVISFATCQPGNRSEYCPFEAPGTLTQQSTTTSSLAWIIWGMRIAESCQGVICGKSSAEGSANYPLSLFRIPQVKNSAFSLIAKLPFTHTV